MPHAIHPYDSLDSSLALMAVAASIYTFRGEP